MEVEEKPLAHTKRAKPRVQEVMQAGLNIEYSINRVVSWR